MGSWNTAVLPCHCDNPLHCGLLFFFFFLKKKGGGGWRVCCTRGLMGGGRRRRKGEIRSLMPKLQKNPHLLITLNFLPKIPL
jgi:hypothetical protein